MTTPRKRGYTPISLTGDKRAKQNSGRPRHQVTCELCGNVTIAWSAKKRYCSSGCQRKAYSQSSRHSAHVDTIPFGNRGAVGELSVCVDLLQRGFEVFRSVSAHASCDLIAIQGELVYRVEVRSAWMNTDSGRVYVNNRGAGRQDILAIYTAEGVSYLNPDKTPHSLPLGAIAETSVTLGYPEK
jgi:hypothetical protein